MIRRRRFAMVIGVVGALVLGAAVQAGAQSGDTQVILCHHPPGNPTNVQTITVGASAVPAHLSHGDTRGACRASASR